MFGLLILQHGSMLVHSLVQQEQVLLYLVQLVQQVLLAHKVA
jgi:hypothetical protein